MLRTLTATVASLIAFAANSLLARAALAGGAIDPLSFTSFRLVSGAAALAIVALVVRGRAARSNPTRGAGSWASALTLFGYAIAFSWAYLSLTAGTGALILFGAVQVTMVGVGLAGGERPRPLRWAGLVAAIGGLVYLLLPGLSAPDPAGATSMALAGVCWGVYSLRGRTEARPILATAGNFARASPPALAALALGALAFGSLALSPEGLGLAIVSGVVTSGLGYVVWYAALGGLSATVAAIVQLAVPVLAAFGGVLFLDERLTPRLTIASVLILGGVGLATLARRR